jgi:SAM-dependent methyltransferase
MSTIAEESLDFVFSSHCLEHNQNWREILQEWVSKLKPGGVAFLYLPHPDCAIWTVGSPFVGTEHKWTPTAQIIKASLKDLGCNIVAFDDGPDAMFSFWVCARRSC